MLIKLAALGALGYLGYRYLQQNHGSSPARRSAEPAIALAGGPLSSQAKLEPSDEPADDWPTLEENGTSSS
jgi:hypothetical protein